jgi:ribose transport system permease protein
MNNSLEATTNEVDASSYGEKEKLGSRLSMRIFLTNEFGLLALIVVFVIIFTILQPGFISKYSLFALGRTAAVNIIIGFSMMVVIITGGLNLAVGSIGVCAAMFSGWLMQSIGVPWPIALLGGLAMGAGLGALDGIVIVRSGLHSFIITLASMSIFFGIMIFLTHAGSYREIAPEVIAPGRMKLFGYVSPLLLITFVVAGLLSILFRYTATGRQMLAAGASPETAELSGVRVNRMTILCHALSGVLAGIAGLMLVSRTGAAIPSMAGQLGQDWLLPAFLGPVLGGTLLTGGRASVLGTLLGALLVTTLTTGLLLLQIGAFWLQTYLGLLLLVAVLMDRVRRSYLARKKLV